MATVSALLSVLLIGISIILYYTIHLKWINDEQQINIEAILTSINNSSRLASKDIFRKKPIAWVTGENMEVGYLHHVVDVLQKIGFRVWSYRQPPSEEYGDWLLLWAHEYPFISSFNLPELKPYQKVNHFPGSGYITNKVGLATSGLKHIPQAFHIPKEKEQFLNFSKQYPDKLWVQKDNNHRGIQVKSIKELNLEKAGTFVQEFIQKPLLIDQKKFDIGLYVTMTSLNPLRVYIYDNEALLRFCDRPYSEPFNSSDLDSYVVGDQYTPIWKIPSLAKYYVDLNMNMKASLNAYIKLNLGRDPTRIWSDMEESIKTVYYNNEANMLEMAGAYPNIRNFFEMVRFDFTLDDQLNVYLMEANMSPNLASAKYPPNRLIYEQVIYNLFSLVGIAHMPLFYGTWANKPDQLWNMLVQDKDLSILPDICSQSSCSLSNSSSCLEEHCDICAHCIPKQFKPFLKDAFMEEMFRGNNRRLIPSTSQESQITLGQNNYLQDKWFIGKCIGDERWCN